MATFFDGEYLGYWSSSANGLYGALVGDVSRSGNTVTLSNLSLHIWSSQTSYGSGGFTFTLEGVDNWLALNPGGGTSDFGWFNISSVSWSVATTQTSSNVFWSTSDGASGSFSVSYPSGATAPTNIRISDIVRLQNGFSAIVSIDSWGVGGSGNLYDYYRELSIWEQGQVGTAPYTYNVVRRSEVDSLSSRIEASEDYHTQTSTLFPIIRNKMYSLGAYATNGIVATGTQFMGNYTTLPPDPTSVSFASQVYETFSTVEATFDFEVPADGGKYPKTIQYRYSANGGAYSEWTDSSAVVSSGSQTSGTFTGIFPTDSECIVEIRSHTNAGNSNSISTTFTTLNTHLGPVFTDYDWQALGSYPVTGDVRVFIQNKTALMVDIQTPAQPRDGVSVISYLVEFDNQTYSIGYEAQPMQLMTNIFPGHSGSEVIRVVAVDALGGQSAIDKSVIVLPYAEPSLSANYERIDDVGRVDVTIVGAYSPLEVEGVEKNVPVVSYRLTDSDGVVIDWTEIDVHPADGSFDYIQRSIPTDYSGIYLIEVRVQDAYATKTVSLTVSAISDKRKLEPPQFDVEVWTREGTFLADITHYVIGDLNITWVLNDVESLDFDISLDALEALKTSGVSVVDILTPYAHDVKVRRNGEYIIGCNVVEANIEIPTDGVPSLRIRSTGYLNLFKDQYISEPMAGYTYPEMAHKLLNRAQHADCLIKNPTGDIDASYWLSTTGTISQSSLAKAGAGSITCRSTQAWVVAGTQMNVPKGTPIMIDFWMVGSNGMTYVRERSLMNVSSDQRLIGEQMHTEGGVQPEVWQHYTLGPYTTNWDNGYIVIEQNPGTGDHWIRLDNVFVYRVDDEDLLNDQYVGTIYLGLDDTTGGTGHNYATSGYIPSREYAYELQNVKDAVMDLVGMEDDNFDFEFTPFKIFNTYDRKGSDRTDIELLYPGNVSSLSFSRSAANLANKVQLIGSGIGDERLEAWAMNRDSRILYGTHESVRTENNVSLSDTLSSMAQGLLRDLNTVTQDLSANIGDGSINCANVQTGDCLAFKTGVYNGVLSQQYLSAYEYEVVGGEIVSPAVSDFDAEDFTSNYGRSSKRPETLALETESREVPDWVARESNVGNVVDLDLDTVREFVESHNRVFEDVRVLDVQLNGATSGEIGRFGVYFSSGIWWRTTISSAEYAQQTLGVTLTSETWVAGDDYFDIVSREVTEYVLVLNFSVGKETLCVVPSAGEYYGVNLIDLVEGVLVNLESEAKRIMPSQSNSLMESLQGWYKVTQINARISPEGKEDMNLTLKFERGWDGS